MQREGARGGNKTYGGRGRGRVRNARQTAAVIGLRCDGEGGRVSLLGGMS